MDKQAQHLTWLIGLLGIMVPLTIMERGRTILRWIVGALIAFTCWKIYGDYAQKEPPTISYSAPIQKVERNLDSEKDVKEQFDRFVLRHRRDGIMIQFPPNSNETYKYARQVKIYLEKKGARKVTLDSNYPWAPGYGPEEGEPFIDPTFAIIKIGKQPLK